MESSSFGLALSLSVSLSIYIFQVGTHRQDKFIQQQVPHRHSAMATTSCYIYILIISTISSFARYTKKKQNKERHHKKTHGWKKVADRSFAQDNNKRHWEIVKSIISYYLFVCVCVYAVNTITSSEI